MCAASASAPSPLHGEGMHYWQDLTGECQRLVECVNATLARNEVPSDGLLRCFLAADKLVISEPRLPSFNIEVLMAFRSWGPAIDVTLFGQRGDGAKFLPQSFELPIAVDGDHQTVAIYDEGRSFSPHEVASFLMQYFHCCYPSVSFPC